MRKYQGELIHCSHDSLGPIEVVDQGQVRSLHFGSDARQSAMVLHDPLYLALSYTRAMCSALLLSDTPQQILLLGLGGGSLAKFLLHHYPDATIDAVELRPQVCEVARRFFSLTETPNLHLHFGDAAYYIRTRPTAQPPYDLLFIDAFGGDGMTESVCHSDFFTACNTHLSDRGILVMNLWGKEHHPVDKVIRQLEGAHGYPVLRLPVEGRENVIVLAGKQSLVGLKLESLEPRAKRLESQMQIEFLSLLRTLRKVNRPKRLHLW